MLRVSAAFHSRYMAAAADEFRNFLLNFNFLPLRFPVMSNARGLAYDEAVAETLAAQIASPVRWEELVGRLLSQGAEFEEIGPGTVLTGLIRRIRAEAASPSGRFLVEKRRDEARASLGGV